MTHARPVHLDPSNCRVRLRGPQVQIEDPKGVTHVLPLNRIAQLQLKVNDNGLLALITRLAEQKRPVFLVDGRGRVLASLVASTPDVPIVDWLADVCHTLRATAAADYPDWRHAQMAHICSRVLPGKGQRINDTQRALHVLRRACRRFQTRDLIAMSEVQLLTQCRGLIERLSTRLGLHPLIDTLEDQLILLQQDLLEIVHPLLLRDYQRRLCRQPRVALHELLSHWQAVEPEMQRQLISHLRALSDWITQSPRRQTPTGQAHLRGAP